MNRKLLLLLDKTLFRAVFLVIVMVARLRPSSPRVTVTLETDAPRILVIRPGGFGDAFMSIAFLRVLKRVIPHAHVTVLCVLKNAAVFQAVQLQDDLIVLDDFSQLWHSTRRLFRGRFDVLFDLEPFRRTSSIVGWLSGAPIRVGFDTNSRRHLYTNLVSYSGDNRFEADNMLWQLRAIGVTSPAVDTQDMRIALSDSARAGARNMLETAGIDLQHHFAVAVAVGALKPHHRWVLSEFAVLIRLIKADDDNARVLLVGSSNDLADAHEVLRELGDDAGVTSFVGKTELSAALGILERCRVLIACDGGILYMAAAMGCNTVSLWGPGVMERFKPPGEDHIGVRKSYACIPCVTWDRLGEFPPCPYGRRCYKDMRASEVFDAYLRVKASLMRGKSP
jgi:ADP-heptose:LPS heptosyltransferase